MQSNKNGLDENGVFLHGCWLRDYHVVIQGDELMTVGVEGFLYLLEVSWQSKDVVCIKLKEEIV